MKTIIHTLAGIALVLVSAGAQAGTQGRVTGRVTDAEGNPIEGVTITITTPALKNFKLTGKTGKDGKYGFIVNDATLNYTMRFEREGFAQAAVDKKFSTIEVTTVDQRLLKPSQAAPALQGPSSASEQAALAYNAGVELLNAGDKDGAGGKFREAVAKNADLPQAWEALTVIAYDKSDWSKVLLYGQKATDLDPTMTSLYPMMGDAAEKLGDKKAAADWRTRYEDANPDSPQILYKKGIEAYNKGKMKDAEAALARAVEVKPDFAMAHYYLGLAALNQKKNSEAKEHLKKYLELDPDGSEAATAREWLAALP
jgi:Tfp pilus assembly protein PilF